LITGEEMATAAVASHDKNRTLEWLGFTAMGTLYTLVSAVAGGPLLATGNALFGYRVMPAAGMGDFTAVTTGQIGNASITDMFKVLSPDAWSATPGLGMIAATGAGASAILSLLLVGYRASESSRNGTIAQLYLGRQRARHLQGG
jgi:hypothetical protein